MKRKSAYGWPSFSEYGGGGTILNTSTSASNLVNECQRHGVNMLMVRDLISAGNEVMILCGEIKAVQRYSMANRHKKG